MTRTSATIVALFFVGLILTGWHYAGSPALPDERLATEQWRVLAVAQLEEDRFLVSVGYANSDIRTYRLSIHDPAQRDEFLKAVQAMRKGRSLVGKARKGRAGLPNDSSMDFQFGDAPEAGPKPGHS